MLEDKDRKHRSLKDQLGREQRYLKRRLESLTSGLTQGQYRIRVERSISECSSSTVSTTSAASEPGETSTLFLRYFIKCSWCYMNVMASEISSNWTVCSSYRSPKNTSKLVPHYWPFVRWIHWSQKASNVERFSMSWRHHVTIMYHVKCQHIEPIRWN